MSPFPLERHTLFVTLAGSQAHGTAGRGSDVDLRGLCVAPTSVRLSLFQRFDQYEGPVPEALALRLHDRLAAHPTAAGAADTRSECVIFDVAKFLDLCASANPNALEILFADEGDWLLAEPTWELLHRERHRFLTQRVKQTFMGYAMAQLKRIRTHRSWLLDPPKHKPTREDFGLPASVGTLGRDDQNRIEQAIAAKLRSYGIDDIEMSRASRIAVHERVDALLHDVFAADADDLTERLRAVATHALGLPPGVAATLEAERRYRSAMKHWETFRSWEENRNPARAALEAEHGYDTKHAMHLVRLMRMGLEALQTGELRVRRPDADELLAIRDGALSYDELMDQATALRAALEGAAAATDLPVDVDRAAVDALLATVIAA